MSLLYVPTDAHGVPLIAQCAGCRREIVATPSNTFGDKPMCRACRRDAERQAADDALGMAWFNGLTETRRAYWLQRAESSRPADAWHYFSRATVASAA